MKHGGVVGRPNTSAQKVEWSMEVWLTDQIQLTCRVTLYTVGMLEKVASMFTMPILEIFSSQLICWGISKLQEVLILNSAIVLGKPSAKIFEHFQALSMSFWYLKCGSYTLQAYSRCWRNRDWECLWFRVRIKFSKYNSMRCDNIVPMLATT